MTLMTEQQAVDFKQRREAEIADAWRHDEVREALATLYRHGVRRSLAHGLMTKFQEIEDGCNEAAFLAEDASRP